MSNKPQDKLQFELEKLNKLLSKQTSPVRIFSMGVLSGVGSVLGATIVASILILLLTQFIKTIDDVPVFGQLIQEFKHQRSSQN